MRKQWMAMLSMLGLAAPAVRVQSQQATATPAPRATRTAPPKSNTGSKGIVQPTETKGIVQPTESKGILISGDKARNSKLNVNQQTLRQQNQGAGRQGDPLATIDTLNKGQKNNDLSRTCANNQLTKAKSQGYGGGGGQTQPGTGNQALTKANVVKGTDVAGGGGAGTKNSQALTKGSAVKGTDVAGGGGAGTKNSQALTRTNLNVNQQNLRQQNQAGRNAAQTTINTTANAAKTVNNNAVQTTKNNAVPK